MTSRAHQNRDGEKLQAQRAKQAARLAKKQAKTQDKPKDQPTKGNS